MRRKIFRFCTIMDSFDYLCAKYKSMTHHINDIYRLRVFTLQDLQKDTGLPLQTLVAMVYRWQKQGLTLSVRKGLYCAVDLATGEAIADRYEIGSRISGTAYIAYHTALEFHGLSHQPFYQAYVISSSRFRPFVFEGISYEYCRETIGEDGVYTPSGNPKVRVTDVERTLVDCIDRLDRCGGIEELLHCMEGISLLDEKKIRKYLDAYGKSFLYQKTGFLLERIQAQSGISDDLIEYCKSKGTAAVTRLTGEDSDTYLREWNFYVPSFILNTGYNHELI